MKNKMNKKSSQKVIHNSFPFLIGRNPCQCLLVFNPFMGIGIFLFCSMGISIQFYFCSSLFAALFLHPTHGKTCA